MSSEAAVCCFQLIAAASAFAELLLVGGLQDLDLEIAQFETLRT
jgi:hypothetical protein